MKTYTKREASHLLCGHWNGSPLEIGLTPLLDEVPTGEVLHRHEYHEYFVVLDGTGSLK